MLDQRFAPGATFAALIEDRAWFVDQILREAWKRFAWSEDADIALLAVGGYRRGELHPDSDIDLLILLDGRPRAASRDHRRLSHPALGHRPGSRPERAFGRRMRRRGTRRPDGDHQPDGKPHHRRPRAPAPAHAARSPARADVAAAGPSSLAKREEQRARHRQVQRHRVQPRAQRQGLARRATRHPDRALGRAPPVRHAATCKPWSPRASCWRASSPC